MSIIIKEVSCNKFEVTINNKIITKHIVILSDKVHQRITNNKVSKKKLLEYSLEFLLDRESNKSILSFFELEIISEYFLEYEKEIRKTILAD